MILKIKSIEIKDERFLKSYTGVDSERYAAIRPHFESVVNAYESSQKKPASQRKRKSGGGRPPKLPSIDDKLVFILHYLKAYPTMDNLASTFGMSRSSACRLVHLHAKHLKQSLERLEVLPKRELENPEELLAYLKSLGEIDQLIIDVTERPYRRLRNPEQRDVLYSGKKSDLPSKTQ